MLAVACVARNRLKRGMWHGLVGMRRRDLNRFVSRHSRKQRKLAQKILKIVFENPYLDITEGAIHFENIKKFGRPKFCKVRIKKIGRHTFYK